MFKFFIHQQNLMFAGKGHFEKFRSQWWVQNIYYNLNLTL